MRARRARRARNARANRGAASARPWPIAPRAGHLRAFFHVAPPRAEERGEAAHVRGRAGVPRLAFPRTAQRCPCARARERPRRAPTITRWIAIIRAGEPRCPPRAGGPRNDLWPGIEHADGLDIFRRNVRRRPHLRVSPVRTAVDEIRPRSGRDRPQFGSVRPSFRRPARPKQAPAARSTRLCGFIAGGSSTGWAAAPFRKIGTALSATRTCFSTTRSFVYPRRDQAEIRP